MTFGPSTKRHQFSDLLLLVTWPANSGQAHLSAARLYQARSFGPPLDYLPGGL